MKRQTVWPSNPSAPRMVGTLSQQRLLSVENKETFCCSKCGAIDFRKWNEIKTFCQYCALSSPTK